MSPPLEQTQAFFLPGTHQDSAPATLCRAISHQRMEFFTQRQPFSGQDLVPGTTWYRLNGKCPRQVSRRASKHQGLSLTLDIGCLGFVWQVEGIRSGQQSVAGWESAKVDNGVGSKRCRAVDSARSCSQAPR